MGRILFVIEMLMGIWPVSSALKTFPNQYASSKSGTFLNPAASVRPRYRYWLPDASINLDDMSDDIVQLADRGAGGIEFLNYYNYGGSNGDPATDWDIYGYATPKYLEVLKAALETHKANGLVMDFAMGPQSGQGVPAHPNNPGLAWELAFFNATIPVNRTYNGQLPGWGEGDLVAAHTFGIVNVTNVSSTWNVGSFGQTTHHMQYEISSEFLTDVTEKVRADGSISVEVSDIPDAKSYKLMAAYARRSYSRACVASNDHPKNIIQNGSFAVDHFSPLGAKVTTDFLEKHILINGIKELMTETGKYIWEDSVEIVSPTYWTPKLPEMFQQQHGYSIKKLLPLLSGTGGTQMNPYSVAIISDDETQTNSYAADFHATMTSLLIKYYEHLTEWSRRYLNLKFSGQIGYNLPVDMLAVVPSVDAPETESLGFANRIDSFRQYCGAATLAGRRVIPIELGAAVLEVYTQDWTELLMNAKRAFVAGINQVIIHGATYSHNYAKTTWPGYTSFNYLFSGQHSRHQPAWDVGYSEANNYLARLQHVLQSGTPKVDLVFWEKTVVEITPGVRYQPTDLVEAGYTYQYLSPDNFALDAAEVRDNVFAPTQQAFRALILRGNDTLTPAGVKYLVEYARSGLPIVISGGVPMNYATSNKSAIRQATRSLESILHLENVHSIEYQDLGPHLSSIGIAPRSRIHSNGTWYTNWHEKSNGDAFVFLHNDGNYSTGTVTFETDKTPYVLDAWTGKDEPALVYRLQNGRTVMQFALQSTETKLIKFANHQSSLPKEHVESTEGPVLGFAMTDTGSGILAKVKRSNETSTLALSSGQSRKIPPVSSVAGPQRLGNWSLIVEKWLPPSDFNDCETVAKKQNVSLHISGPNLEAWSDLDLKLTNISGIGYYSTDFKWNPQPKARAGAILSLPPIAQGIVAYLNGKQLPELDITNPVVDVSDHLVRGSNKLLLKISTTLWNGVILHWDMMKTGGDGPVLTLAMIEAAGITPSAYGMVGEVILTSYEAISIL